MSYGHSSLDRALFQELLSTYGPPGQEDAVRDVCHRELQKCVDETWSDPAGNLIGRIREGTYGQCAADQGHGPHG